MNLKSLLCGRVGHVVQANSEISLMDGFRRRAKNSIVFR